MTDVASHSIVETLRHGLRWLKSFEDSMDFSMDEHLLGRIRALEQLVSGFEARIDRLSSEPPAHAEADTVASLTPAHIAPH